MNKKLLTQTGIIIIGLLTAYKTIDQLLALILWSFYDSPFSRGEDNALLLSLVILLMYLAIMFLCFRFSDRISAYITQKSFAGDASEPTGLNLTTNAIIRIALVILALNTMIGQLDDFFSYISTMFRTDGMDPLETAGTRAAAGNGFKVSLFKFVIAFLILYFAGPMARWVDRISKPESRTQQISEPE